MLRLLPFFTIFALLALALPAHALDCAGADLRDAMSKAICADPALKTADQEMNAAYQALYKGRDKLQQRVIKTLQLAWLHDDRDPACKTPESAECISTIRRRTDFLNSANGIGPSNQGRLVFKGLYKPYKKPGDMKAEVSLYEFETPDTEGKKAFNAEVERLMHEAADEQGTDDCDTCEVDASLKMPFQADNFISAAADYWAYSGGAHGNGVTNYLNYRLDNDKPLSFGDLLVEFDAPVMAKACYDQVMKDNPDLEGATTDLNGANPRPSNAFMEAFGSLSNWQFDGKSIKVNFGLYVLGAYVQGVQSCMLTYDQLRPHLTDNAKLPGDRGN